MRGGVAGLEGGEAAAEAGGFVTGDGEGDLGSGFGAAFFVGQILGEVVAVDDGVVEPGDAAWVAVAADMAEVEDVGGGDILVLAGGAVGDDAVGEGRAEFIEEDAVEGAVAAVGGGPDGLASYEADAGGPGGGGEELGEEVAIDGDLAEDEGLRAVEVDLRGGVEGPGVAAHAVFEEAFGAAVPLGIGGAGLGDDAGADGALGEVLDEVAGDADIVVEPAGFFEELGAGVGGGFALGVGGIQDDEAALAGELGGFEGGGVGGGFGGAACSGAEAASV